MRASRRVERTAKSSNSLWLNFTAGGKAAFKNHKGRKLLQIAKVQLIQETHSVPFWEYDVFLVSGTANHKNAMWISAETAVQKSILFNLAVQAHTHRIKKNAFKKQTLSSKTHQILK